MRLRSSVLVIAFGVIAVAAASLISLYPSASDARDVAEGRWERAQPALVERYDRAASFSRAVRAARPDVDVLDDLDDALGGWKDLVGRRPTPDADEEPGAANRVEALAARLARIVTESPALSANPDVVTTLRDYLDTDPRAALEAYNDAVEKYDRSRSRFPGRFFASLIGFDSMMTVEVPGALDDLAVPDPPPETTTTTVGDGEGEGAPPAEGEEPATDAEPGA